MLLLRERLSPTLLMCLTSKVGTELRNSQQQSRGSRDLGHGESDMDVCGSPIEAIEGDKNKKSHWNAIHERSLLFSTSSSS